LPNPHSAIRHSDTKVFIIIVVWWFENELVSALNTIWIDLPGHLKFLISWSVVCWFVNSYSNVVCFISSEYFDSIQWYLSRRFRKKKSFKFHKKII
jgi:hypothetical protein